MTALHTQGQLTLCKWASASGGPDIKYVNGSAAQQVFHCQPMDSADHVENARRLVTCWNALEGVPTEEIEGFMAHMAEVRAHIGVVGRKSVERTDELAAARALLNEVLGIHDAAASYDLQGLFVDEFAEGIRAFLEPKP